MRTLGLVLVLLLVSGRATADFQSGSTLLTICQDTARPMDRMQCLGYIQGISDVSGHNTISGWRACGPEDLTGLQAMDIVLKHLREHPEDRHLAASSLVARALAEAFPCK